MIIAGSGKIMLKKSGSLFRLPYDSEVGITDDAETFSFGSCTAVSPRHACRYDADIEERGLRESWALISAEDFEAASKGAELLNWNNAERYCPADGAELSAPSGISKRCPKCGREYFPRLNPAIVVLVTKGDEALLVHARTLPGNVHALVAGFVETGETLEQCVEREIKEETGIDVENVRYVGSQAWPFPSQLMMGFTARWKAGDVVFADGELSSGGFFRRDNIPELPTPPSLSRSIIDAWLEGRLPEA